MQKLLSKKRLKRIHINQHNIKKNIKDRSKVPVISIKTYNGNHYANDVIIYGQDGKEAARLVYSPEKPLSCGAKVWIETRNEVRYE